ncbi:hypothetical protein BJY04DRAFT_36465 [Aspergillus karnatakaensis]|uniref:uncharacterized protein n=1 Tax=Aspergillus karnatakaensis TaxID=1810916 RepID=UPI003CCD9DDA
MKPSSLSSFNLFSKINPPLPRTPRESEKLLNAITSSFRRELDREHPPTASPSDQSSAASNIDNTIRTHRRNPHSSAQATDAHLSTILNNPLFRVPLDGPDDISGRAQKVVRKWAKDPMVAFDQHVASGSATVEVAVDCLSRQLVIVSTESGENFRKALRDSKAGSRIVSWWLSLSPRMRVRFLSHHKGPHFFCKFIAAEDSQDVIMGWLELLAETNLDLPELVQPVQASRYFKNLLVALLEAEFECGGGLESCIRYYMKAYRLLESSADRPLPLADTFRLPLSIICQLLVLNARSKAEKVPADLYEEFQTTVPNVTPARHATATVSIYHPTHPDAKLFVKFVRNLPPQTIESWHASKRQGLMQVAADAVHLVAEAENWEDCILLARFVQKYVGEKREAIRGPWGRQPSGEEKDLLTNLDLAF